MAKYLLDLAVGASESDGRWSLDRKEFNRYSNYVANVYTMLCLKPRSLRTDGVSKIYCEVVPGSEISTLGTRQLDDVVTVHASFPVGDIAFLTESARRRELLDFLHAQALFVAAEYSWDTEPLRNAYDCCLDRSIEFVALGQKVRSPDGSRAARLRVVMDEFRSLASLEVWRTRDLLLDVEVKDHHPGRTFARDLLELPVRWISNGEVEVQMRPEAKRIRVPEPTSS
jgi:hypothetical protein